MALMDGAFLRQIIGGRLSKMENRVGSSVIAEGKLRHCRRKGVGMRGLFM